MLRSSIVQKAKPKPVKGAFEQYARMARNRLLDMLLLLYRDRLWLSSRDLQAHTEQPEVDLKEVLGQIADLHQNGEFNGQDELKSSFKESVGGCAYSC